MHTVNDDVRTQRLYDAAPEMYEMLVELKERLDFEAWMYIYSDIGLCDLLDRIDGTEDEE